MSRDWVLINKGMEEWRGLIADNSPHRKVRVSERYRGEQKFAVKRTDGWMRYKTNFL